MTAMTWLSMLFGCSHGPSHPPQFADFHRIGPGVMEDGTKLAAYLAVFEQAMLSPSDTAAIRWRGKAREMIGAAMQGAVGDESCFLLAREAVLCGSNLPVVLTGAAKSLTKQAFQQTPDAEALGEFASLLSDLERLEPGNGLPECLRAYAQLKSGETNAAKQLLQAAMRKPSLALHGPELRRCVMEAATSVNYPRYTASMLALGTLGMSTEISVLGRGLLNDPQLDRATAEACLEMARRHEAQATLFIEQLIAFSLQKRALEFLKSPGFEKDLERIKDVRERIKNANAFLNSAEMHKLSEAEWLKYYVKLFEKSEMDAAIDLAARFNRKF